MELSEKIKLVERATWENSRTAEADGDRWVQLTTPYAPTAFLNGVLRCELGEDEIFDKVKSTVAHYKNLGLPFRWKIVPSSRPKNLDKILLEHEMYLKEKLYGLIADASTLQIAANPDVRVEEVTLENLEDWLKAQISAWKTPPEGIIHQRQRITEILKKEKRKTDNFLAYLDNKPVGSAALQWNSDYAYLMGGAVNPEVRRMGIYRTLTAHRLKLIAAAGVPAVIHCLEKTSAPICLKLGFEKVCEIDSYEPTWAK